MVMGRAAASLTVPGRGKGSRRGTKVQSWSWAGDLPQHTHRGVLETIFLLAKCNLPQTPRG